MSFTYAAADGVTQGELASGYTNALMAYLKTEEGADYAAFLAYDAGMSMADALALKAAVMNGEFSLSGLFGAAQSKTGPVDGANVADPTPTLAVGTAAVDLSGMLDGLTTATWKTVTKTGTVFHTREFYTASETPAGYDADWDLVVVENQPPTADPIVISDLLEYDEHAQGADQTGTPVLTDVNLLTQANADDPDDDPLSVVAGSVTLDNGDPLPDYISYQDGILSIDRNHPSLDALHLDDTWNVLIKYEITDGQGHTISNTVNLTITGTADQFTDDAVIEVAKGDSVADFGSYDLLGFDWSNVNVDVTGYGDYDRNIEGFTVTLDVDATYAGSATTGNNESSFINVDPNQTLDANWSDDGDLDYQVSFPGPVDGYTDDDPDASVVMIGFTYDYWL